MTQEGMNDPRKIPAKIQAKILREEARIRGRLRKKFIKHDGPTLRQKRAQEELSKTVTSDKVPDDICWDKHFMGRGKIG